MDYFDGDDIADLWGWGVRCQACGDIIPSAEEHGTGYCLDCEFDKLTPPAWMEIFMVNLARWTDDYYKAS